MAIGFAYLMDSAAHTRLMTMGLVLLLVLRFSLRGLIPEVTLTACLSRG